MWTQMIALGGKTTTAGLCVVFVVALFMSSPVFSGTIYKCVAEDGSIVYQQTPCCEEDREEEVAFPEFMSGKDGQESEHAESIRNLKKKSDIQYFERKIKESENRIESLKKSKQNKIDYWRGVMMYATEEVQTIKIEKLMDSVADEYDRRIENEQNKKEKLEKRLAEVE